MVRHANRGPTIAEALRHATDLFKAADHDSARLEAEVLLAHLLNISRVKLFIELNSHLSGEQTEAFQDLVNRHLAHEPVAYIVGHREFFGLEFTVDRRVLIPRPETELLVERVLDLVHGVWQLPSKFPLRIADIGTGSGAIAISLATSLPQANVYAIDSSASSLEVAAINCRAHGVEDRVRILRGDLLSPLPEPVAIVVANLPYVPSAELPRLQPEVAYFEPAGALDGGEDGLDFYRRMLRQLPGKILPGGYLLFEIGADQGSAMLNLVASTLPNASAVLEKDYAGLDRLVVISTGQETHSDPCSAEVV